MICPNCKVPLVVLDVNKDTYRVECAICGYNSPLVGKNTKKIEEVYTWVSVDSEGKEGILGFMTPMNVFMIAQHSERAMALKLKPKVKAAISGHGLKGRLLKFVRTAVEDEI